MRTASFHAITAQHLQTRTSKSLSRTAGRHRAQLASDYHHAGHTLVLNDESETTEAQQQQKGKIPAQRTENNKELCLKEKRLKRGRAPKASSDDGVAGDEAGKRHALPDLRAASIEAHERDEERHGA